MKTHAAFLSSTFVDLQDHRKAVAAALERLGLHVVWMERFGAKPDEPVTACLGEVAGCDLFIGLYAHRYGFVPGGQAVSITEVEFEHARVRNKPVFCFFVRDDHPWPPPHVEGDPGKTLLAAFRTRVGNQVVRDVFTTPDDLAAKVTASVGAYLKDKAYPPDGDQVAVERVTDATAPEVLAALNLFTRRIPADERFEQDDIVRWLVEDQEQQRQGRVGPRDFFLVARTRSRVCGFTLLHYYPGHRLAFIAYLAAEKEIALARGTIANRLFEGVAKLLKTDEHLRECEGFLVEVDDPRHAETERERQRRLARVGLFCTLAQSRGYTLRALGIDYHHPLLNVPEPRDRGTELPMLLMYASRQPDPYLPRERVEALLGFVYLELYPEGFSAVEAENVAYRAYLKDFYQSQTAGLPAQVRLLGTAEVRRLKRSGAGSPPSTAGQADRPTPDTR